MSVHDHSVINLEDSSCTRNLANIWPQGPCDRDSTCWLCRPYEGGHYPYHLHGTGEGPIAGSGLQHVLTSSLPAVAECRGDVPRPLCMPTSQMPPPGHPGLGQRCPHRGDGSSQHFGKDHPSLGMVDSQVGTEVRVSGWCVQQIQRKDGSERAIQV